MIVDMHVVLPMEGGRSPCITQVSHVSEVL
jgi:hypothetical protein